MAIHFILNFLKKVFGLVDSNCFGYNCMSFLTVHHSLKTGAERLSRGKVLATQA